MPVAAMPSFPQRAAAIRRAVGRLCLALEWAPLHEVPLPNGRRADILALRPDGDFACIEIKSGVRDFLADAKWWDYCEFCDALFFAVDCDFPREMLPDGVGVIVADETGADILAQAPSHRIAPARRRALTQRFASLAAGRLACVEDPGAAGFIRAGLRAE